MRKIRLPLTADLLWKLLEKVRKSGKGRAWPAAKPAEKSRCASSPPSHCAAPKAPGGLPCALAQGVPHPNAVRLVLGRAREEQGVPPPSALRLSEEVARRAAPVRSHALVSYDHIVQVALPAPGEPRDE